MRHIPEEELHAYLDQALSRSQCVEIERHLARCARCHLERDEIAALRDRTTALLARIGPPPIVPPAFEGLVVRAAARRRRRWQWLTTAAWAASLAGAVALGWGVNRRAHPLRPSAPVREMVVAASDAPAVEPVQAVPTATKAPAAVRRRAVRPPAPVRQLVRATRPVGDEAPAAVGFAKATETDPLVFYAGHQAEPVTLGAASAEIPDLIAQPVGDDPGLHGLWRTIVPDNAADRESDIPLVPGLPVLQMRVQPGNGRGDVTAVDQMLESGEVIRTISGPAPRVLALVDEDDHAAEPSPESTSSDHMTVTIRQADRMVAVTGPSQALGSLLARVNIKNAKRRY